MATTKRERQRANRSKGREDTVKVDVQEEKKRNFIKFGVIAALIVVALLVYACVAGGGDDGGSVTLTADGKATAEDLLEWQRDAGSLAPVQRTGLYAGPSPMVLDTSKTYEAVIETDNGEMRFTLFDDEAPITVNNFINLASDGYFDGLSFHRVLENFMAQGGDPTGIGTGGPGYQFVNEYTPGIEFDSPGQLAMARSSRDTNGSQFFVTFTESSGLQASDYTLFGEITDGMDVLEQINLRDPETATEPGDIMTSVRIEEVAE